ncbi:hypothetical protein BDZ97DRAFT_847973 [Flammula alnicola]|nr:hypothetical protein BDZ97DRAFT_847973 [Flammula alnicola]
MHDTRFLSHLIFPPVINANPTYAPQWSAAPYSVYVNDMYPSRPQYAGRPGAWASSTRRRSHQQSLGRHSGNYHSRSLPWPVYHTYRKSLYPRTSEQSSALSPIHLTRKPRDWRGSYKSPSKGGLGKYLSRIGSIIPRSPSFHSRFRLNPIISHHPNRSISLIYDLRVNPTTGYDLRFQSSKRSPNAVDLYQLATSPPTSRLLIWHNKLPWYIKVEASNPNGVTVQDVLLGIYEGLRRPIGHHEYYTVELTPEDREMLGLVFQKRCRGDPDEISGGVRRVDFLRGEVRFIGLTRRRNGTWEMRTTVPEHQRMTIVGVSFYMLDFGSTFIIDFRTNDYMIVLSANQVGTRRSVVERLLNL